MYAFEIFDWGCGQGIATLVLLEMLRERELLGRLKAITLIEPSPAALARAKYWVASNAGPGVDVRIVNKYIPTSETDTMDEVCCNSQVSINLFSNVLDIQTLSLKWLAEKTGMLANINYMVCIGPKFYSNTRIADFCGYFQPKNYFSQISAYPYAYTSKKNHPFGCEARGFMHRKHDGINSSYIEQADNVTFANDYDYAAECMRGTVNDKLLNLYNELRCKCDSTYNVFLRPAINTDTVDLLLASVDKGIVLLNICEETEPEPISIAIRRIETIKNILFDTCLRTIKIDSIINSSVYNCIKIGLFFTNLTEQEAADKLADITSNPNNSENEEKQKRNYQANTIQYLVKIAKDSDYVDKFKKQKAQAFKYEYYQEILSIIVGKWHSYKDGDLNFRLNKRQEEIVRSIQPRIRIKGVAGCGKTQMVANRAVERHIKTGEKVLIITFNISLVQYMKMRIRQVPADFATNMFEIASYHQFFKSKANQYGNERLMLSNWDDAYYFERYKDRIEKYKTIIIDEVQDFKSEWLDSIIHYFLKEDGTISVFGDGEQNIYDRTLEKDTKMPVIPTFTGKWGEVNERISLRIQNKDIAHLASAFSAAFLDKDTPALTIQERHINFEKYYIRYWNLGINKEALQITKNIEWIINKYGLKKRSTVVLAETIDLLRDVNYYYCNEFYKHSMISFETKEQYQAVESRNYSPMSFKQILYAIRRTAKTHFTTDCEELKLSTIHSFKGWEADSVILLLQPENTNKERLEDYHITERESTPALIYTAITRPRCNLFIINLGNSRYDKFFKNNIKQ